MILKLRKVVNPAGASNLLFFIGFFCLFLHLYLIEDVNTRLFKLMQTNILIESSSQL